jgi:hypothetical protein
VENLHGRPADSVDGETLTLRYRQLHALGWWRAMKGNEWPAAQTSPSPGASRPPLPEGED